MMAIAVHDSKIYGYDRLKSRLLSNSSSIGIPVILVGQKGVGKRTMIREYARELVYETMEVDDISVEAIHNLRLKLQHLGYGTRVLLISGVDRANHNSANAMLLLLEEPPANTMIFLTAESISSVLDTIKSRCVIEYIPPISEDMMREFADDHGISHDAVRWSCGLPGLMLFLSKDRRWEAVEKIYNALPWDGVIGSAELLADEDVRRYIINVLPIWLVQYIAKGLSRKLVDDHQEFFESMPVELWIHLWDRLNSVSFTGVAADLQWSVATKYLWQDVLQLRYTI